MRVRSEAEKQRNRDSASAHYYANVEVKKAYVRERYATRCADPALLVIERKRSSDSARKSRSRLSKNPDWVARKNAKQRAWSAAMKSTPEGWLHIVLTSVKGRAKYRGLPFDLVAADVELPTHCPITKVRLVYGCGVGRKDGPSIDRIRPHLGYVKGNVRVISFLANSLKSDCTDPAIFRALAEDAERLFGPPNG